MDRRILDGYTRDVEDIANNILTERIPGGPEDRLVEIARSLIAEVHDQDLRIESLKQEIYDLEDEVDSLTDQVMDLEYELDECEDAYH